MAVAADVPHKYDLVLNGEGYMFADLEEVKAQYGYTPTFVPRGNLQGDYGDNFQDFWLSASQRDWSLGEQQRFFRPDDQISLSRYWRGKALDVTVDGQVAMRRAVRSVTSASNIRCAAPIGNNGSGIVYAASDNLFTLGADGTITDHGAHGLGTFPDGICTAGVDTFITSEQAGTVGVRKWNGTVFSTFSASAADELAYLNNTLFGFSESLGALVKWDTAGVRSTVHTFQEPDGGGITLSAKIAPFGGKLAILLRHWTVQSVWLYDGVGVTKIWDIPKDMLVADMIVVNGVIYVSGTSYSDNGASGRGVILYYANGSQGVLWRSRETGISLAPKMAEFDGGVVWQDDIEAQFMYYDPARGGVHAIGAYTVGSLGPAFMQGCAQHFIFRHASTNTTIYQGFTNAAAITAELYTSLFDFDSSLTKIFRGIKVDYDEGDDGDGGSVDIAYQVGDLDGAYTTLQVGAVSGTEYTLTNITGRSIAVKITLNKGTSTDGPVLKRVSVRAVPKQASFRKETFVIQCTGRDGASPLELRDGTLHHKDGLSMAQDLRTAVTTTNPISITDEFGTFTGVIDAEGFQLRRVRANEFLAVVPVREV